MSDIEMEAESSAVAVDSGGELVELVEKFKVSVLKISSIENVEDVSELYVDVEKCMERFLPKLRSILQLPEAKDPTKVVLPSPKNKKWKAIQGIVKTYLAALIQALSSAEGDLKALIGKRMPEIIVYYSCFPKLSKVAIEKMIGLWSSEGDQVFAANCINQLMRHIPPKQFEESLTRMYAVFCKSCKGSTAKSLPLINEMKRSLVEIMSIRPDLAYNCAFASVKGMAKKLRNVSDGYQQEKTGRPKRLKAAAENGEKDGKVAPICNWQHVHLTSFWIALLCQLKSDAKMQTLVHHIVEIVNDTVRANSSVQYYPLRFNCLRMLIELCCATELFVPVLPFLIEVIDSSALQTKAFQNTKSRFNFETTLKVLKTEVHERVFLDEVVDNCFQLTLQYCVCFRHSVAFPELVQTTIEIMRKFVKNCPVPAYTSKMKTLVQKLEEHSNLVKKRRAAANLDLHDASALQSWEKGFKEEKNSLTVFFDASKKKRLEKKESITSHEETIEAEKQSKAATDNGEGEEERDEDVSDDDEDTSDDSSDDDDEIDDESSFDEEEMEFEDASDSGGDV